MPVPPAAATSRGCAKLQKNSKTAVYDGYYAHKQGLHPTVVTIAPPIQTFHQVFQEFVDRVNDPAFEPSDEVVSIISELMSTAAEIDPSEDKALLRLRPLLSRLLGGFVGQVTSIGTSTPDGMMLKQPDERAASLVCIEYKRAFGEGGYDPSTQASYSVREFLVSPQVRGFHMFCTSPDMAFSPRKSLKSVVAHLSSSDHTRRRLYRQVHCSETHRHHVDRRGHYSRRLSGLLSRTSIYVATLCRGDAG